MLVLNKAHPSFEMKKEVACLIPKLPRSAEMRSICDDLQISRDRLNQLIVELQATYRINFVPGKDDMAIGSPRMSWAELDKMATRYYNHVYAYERRQEQNGV